MNDPCAPAPRASRSRWHRTARRIWRHITEGPRASTGRAHLRATDCASPPGKGTVASKLAATWVKPALGVAAGSVVSAAAGAGLAAWRGDAPDGGSVIPAWTPHAGFVQVAEPVYGARPYGWNKRVDEPATALLLACAVAVLAIINWRKQHG